jgi:hypothetical protein
MLFAHPKRILKLDRRRLRGPKGAHDEFLLAATAQKFEANGKGDDADRIDITCIASRIERTDFIPMNSSY